MPPHPLPKEALTPSPRLLSCTCVLAMLATLAGPCRAESNGLEAPAREENVYCQRHQAEHHSQADAAARLTVLREEILPYPPAFVRPSRCQ